MPQYNVLDQPGVQKTLAARSLYQLFKNSFFLKAGVTQLDTLSSFEQNESVALMRPRLTGEAEDYDPRNALGNAALLEEPGHVKVDLSLEKLFTKGFPIYSNDANQARYIEDYSESIASSLRLSCEKYLYEKCFRSYLIAPTGVVKYGANAPINTVWDEDALGVLQPMKRQLLVRADAVLKSSEVPDMNRYAALSPDSVGDLFINSPTDEGQVGYGAGGVGLLADGLPAGVTINRYGFKVGSSSTIQGQSRVVDVSAGAPAVAIASAVLDATVFLRDDQAGNTPLGAINITVGGALTPGAVGVGTIIRVGANAVKALAYGVVLRVGGGVITVRLFSADGKSINSAAQVIPGTHQVSVPAIAAISPAYHKEHVAFATRLLKPPGENTGAVFTPVSDRESGVTMQLMRGSYDVNRFRESCRMAMLIGSTPTDFRKAVLMLSA